MKNIKNTTGITLSSLIITIIVMLILVGISLLITIGEEGILRRTDNAKTKQLISIEKDNILTAQVYMYQEENIGKVSYEKTKEALSKLGYKDEDIIYNETDNTLIIKYKNQTSSEKEVILENVIKEENGIWYDRGLKEVTLDKKYVCKEYEGGVYVIFASNGNLIASGTVLDNEYFNSILVNNKEEGEKSLSEGAGFAAYISQNTLFIKSNGASWSTYKCEKNKLTWSDEGFEGFYYFDIEK